MGWYTSLLETPSQPTSTLVFGLLRFVILSILQCISTWDNPNVLDHGGLKEIAR